MARSTTQSARLRPRCLVVFTSASCTTRWCFLEVGVMQGQHRCSQMEKLKVGIVARRRSWGGRRFGLGNEVWKHRNTVSQTWLSVVWKVGWRAPEQSPNLFLAHQTSTYTRKRRKFTRQCDTPWQREAVNGLKRQYETKCGLVLSSRVGVRTRTIVTEGNISRGTTATAEVRPHLCICSRS